MTMPPLFAAPHRMPFLAGTLGLSGLALWWLVQLVALHAGGPVPPQTTLPVSLLHGPAMIYAGFTPLIFGFLLTVFPRWMGQSDLGPSVFGPVGIALLGGVTALQVGLWAGLDWLVLGGFAAIALGWLIALTALAAVLKRDAGSDRPRCWHAWSALAALALGMTGVSAATAFVATGDAQFLYVANRLGIGGLLLPVFLTVSHRMVPFFAANVVEGYNRWRPDWLLAALWLLLLARLGGELLAIAPLTAIANLGLAMTTGVMCWKWWPRSSAPGLLLVLVWGFAWAPAGFALAAFDGVFALGGRGPDHALLIGFAGSLMIGMVTRVTQGHSGRPLTMPITAWIAFAAIQLAAASRIIAAIYADHGYWLLAAITVFALGLLPWAARNGAIYLKPRRDGKAG